jgi:hypothetical protein
MNGRGDRRRCPFAETREAVGGFDLIECASLEKAVEIAAADPMGRRPDDRGAPALGTLSAVAA